MIAQGVLTLYNLGISYTTDYNLDEIIIIDSINSLPTNYKVDDKIMLLFDFPPMLKGKVYISRNNNTTFNFSDWVLEISKNYIINRTKHNANFSEIVDDGSIVIYYKNLSALHGEKPSPYDIFLQPTEDIPLGVFEANDIDIASFSENINIGYKPYNKLLDVVVKFFNPDDSQWHFAFPEMIKEVRKLAKTLTLGDLADSKARVFVDTPTAPYDIGDLWINDGNLLKATVNQTTTYNVNDWFIATKYTDDTTANLKNTVFTQSTTPTANNLNDIWIDTSDNNHPKIWDGNKWKTVRDGAIALVSANVSDALSIANTALNQSDGTITVFYENTDPQVAGKPVGIGDIWVDIGSNPEMSYRWRTDTNGDDTDKWMAISDTGISAALVAAQNAQTTADGKIVASYVDGPTGPAKTSDDTGDLWYDTADNNKPYYWNGTIWVPIQDGTIAIAQTAADVADGKAMIANGIAVEARTTSNGILQGINGYKLDLTQHLVGNYTLNEYVTGEVDKQVKVYSGSDHTSTGTAVLKSGDLYIEYTTAGSGNKKIDVINSYRYDGINWISINTNENLIALADKSDNKRTIFGGTAIPVNPQINDMWIPETGATALDVNRIVVKPATIYLWGLSGWYSATKYTDDSKLESFLIDGNTKLDLTKAYLGSNSFITELNNQINDHKIEIYSGSDHTQQTIHKEKDLYIETVTITTEAGTNVDKNNTYQWHDANGWVKISNNDNILALADKTDRKRTVFGDDPNVSIPTGIENDLWIPSKTSSNGTYNKGELYQSINGVWTAAAYANNISAAKKALINLTKHDGVFAAARAEGEFTIYTTAPTNPNAYDILAVPLDNLSLAEYDATSPDIVLLSDKIKWDGIPPTSQTSITFKYYNPDEENWVLCTPTMFNAIKVIAQKLEAKAFTDSKARVFNIQPFTPYDEGDLWIQGINGDILRCVNSRQTGDYVNTDWEIGTKYTDDSTVIELNNGLKDGSVPVNLAKATIGTTSLSKYVANEADNRVHIYSGTELPAKANLEGVDVGDIYIQHTTVTDNKGRKYNSTSTFKYNNVSWIKIDNNKNITNLSDLADSKRTIYAGTTLPEIQIGLDGKNYIPEVRDLWIPESTITINNITYTEGEIYVYTSSSTWKQKVRYTKDLVNYIDAISLNSVTLDYQTDGQVVYWFKPSTKDPKTIWVGTNTSHNGDIWYQTDTELGFWYNSTDNLWLTIDDEVTLKAVKSASKLSSAVDGKLTRFYGSETEMNAETKMQDGDVWFNPDLKTSYIYNSTTREWVPVTERSGQLFNAPWAEPPTGNINDIWMVTDRWYTENVNNKKEFVSAPDIDINGATITNVHKLRVSKIHDGTDWILQDYDSDASTHINWIGGASKLLYAPDGGITGWEFQDGSGHQSEFKINAQKFKISDGIHSANIPFSIVAGSPNKVQFTGIVDFTSTINDSGYKNSELSQEISNASTTANWTSVEGTPTNLSNLNGSESINNNGISISADGRLLGGNGGQVKLKGPNSLGYTGDLNATNGADMATNVTNKSLANLDSDANNKLVGIAPNATKNQDDTITNNRIDNASTTANWTGVTGSDKPADNATKNRSDSDTDKHIVNTNYSINMIENSDWADGLVTVSKYSSNKDLQNANILSIRSASTTDTWSPNDRGILQVQQGDPIDTTTYVMIYIHKTDSNNTKGWVAVPGRKYAASCYVGAHRCTIKLYLVFRKADNTWLSAVSSNSNAGHSGAANESKNTLLSCSGTAPTDTAYVQIVFYKSDTMSGQTSSFLFAHKPMLTEVNVNSLYDTTHPVPYMDPIETTKGAQSKAEQAKNDAIAVANTKETPDGAQNKANAAKTAAISRASSDATAKAKQAKNDAISEASKLAASVTGVLPAYSNTNKNTLTFAEGVLSLQGGTDTTTGMVFKAFRVNLEPGENWNIQFSYKTDVAVDSGFFFRVYEYDADLPVGKTHISDDAGGSDIKVVQDTRRVTTGLVGGKEDTGTSTTYSLLNATYYPTSSAKYASIVILNWSGMSTHRLDITGWKVTRNTTIQDVLNHPSTTIDGGRIDTNSLFSRDITFNGTITGGSGGSGGIIRSSNYLSSASGMEIDLINGSIYIT